MEMGLTSEGLIRKTLSRFFLVKSDRSDKGRFKSLKKKYNCRLIFSIQHKDLKIYQRILSESQIWD